MPQSRHMLPASSSETLPYVPSYEVPGSMSDPVDKYAALLELHAGTGGTNFSEASFPELPARTGPALVLTITDAVPELSPETVALQEKSRAIAAQLPAEPLVFLSIG